MSSGVIPVREAISREAWPFECLHCLRVWEEEYVVHRARDEQGVDVVVWTRDDVAVQPPWSGMTCPACGCGTVTTFSTGYLAHRPKITLGRPPLDTPLDAPLDAPLNAPLDAPLDAPAGEAPARGAPFASPALLTLALLLLAGAGLYEQLHVR
ncbi:hypothetical protein GCM10011574_24860 [Microbispora bryophytorum]|uniref:Uncharacterized protein n=1 Tax=Microbispora bryophytorum TaxID=1460882 RepID=A0A8H9L9W4_9ACTN|nr:hypothetical protein GCM10011574_24860 [Microbispora bryophytorum]